MKHVVILGGGFAGVQAAIELQKSRKFKVTLVSDRDYLYIYPISIWIPVRNVEFESVKVPLEKIRKAYKFDLVTDAVEEIRSKDKLVILRTGQIGYDYLVVAFGADKMKHKGIEHTLSICGKPEVSLSIRDAIDKLLIKGSGKIAVGFGGNPRDKSAVRGGPGFELMFNIHNMLKKKGLREKFDLTFFAPMEEPGARMGKNSLAMLNRLFGQYKIDRKFGKKILEFKPGAVVFEDQSTLDADLVIFIPASTGHQVLLNSDLPLNDAGFVRIDNYCQVPGVDSVYAIGDAAAIEGPEWIAKQGHIAELMGRNTAYNILQSEEKSTRGKQYQKDLNILCVMDTGNGAAFVFRNDLRSFIIPLPIVGHWMKKGWGVYSKLTKLGKFPRLPGL